MASDDRYLLEVFRMTIIGVDPSSLSLAFCADHAIWGKHTLSKKFQPSNCHLAYMYTSGFLATLTLTQERVAWIEAPVVAGARNIQSTIKQALVSGAMQAAFGAWGFDIHLVPPATWKSKVGIGGNASKEIIAQWLKTEHPDWASACGGDPDLYDATCIAHYGAGVVIKGRRLVSESGM